MVSASLLNRQEVTLDTEVSDVLQFKRDARYTYNKNKGFAPMVRHIAETDQIVVPETSTQKKQHGLYRAQRNLNPLIAILLFI